MRLPQYPSVSLWVTEALLSQLKARVQLVTRHIKNSSVVLRPLLYAYPVSEFVSYCMLQTVLPYCESRHRIEVMTVYLVFM